MKWRSWAGSARSARACFRCRPAVARRSCAPSSRATDAAEFPNAHTCASGLRVPKAVGDFLMLRILRESKGGAIAVDDEEMIAPRAKLERPKDSSSRRKARPVLRR